jgi:hypothetical protein
LFFYAPFQQQKQKRGCFLKLLTVCIDLLSLHLFSPPYSMSSIESNFQICDKERIPPPLRCASFLVCCYYVSGDFGAMNWNRASALVCLGKDMFLFHGFLLLWSIVSGVIDESSDSLTAICQQKGSIEVTILRLVRQSSALLWFAC